MKKIAKFATIFLCLTAPTFAMETEEGAESFKAKTLTAVQQTRAALKDFPVEELQRLSALFLTLAHPNAVQKDECFAVQTYLDGLVQNYNSLVKELNLLDPTA